MKKKVTNYKAIYKERRRRRWGLNRASKELGLSPNIISKIEKGKMPITNTIALSLKCAYGLKIKPHPMPKDKEIRILENIIKKAMPEYEIALDQGEKIVTILAIAPPKIGGRATTVFTYAQLIGESQIAICNEAKGLCYEIIQKIIKSKGEKNNE